MDWKPPFYWMNGFWMLGIAFIALGAPEARAQSTATLTQIVSRTGCVGWANTVFTDPYGNFFWGGSCQDANNPAQQDIFVAKLDPLFNDIYVYPTLNAQTTVGDVYSGLADASGNIYFLWGDGTRGHIDKFAGQSGDPEAALFSVSDSNCGGAIGGRPGALFVDPLNNNIMMACPWTGGSGAYVAEYNFTNGSLVWATTFTVTGGFQLSHAAADTSKIWLIGDGSSDVLVASATNGPNPAFSWRDTGLKSGTSGFRREFTNVSQTGYVYFGGQYTSTMTSQVGVFLEKTDENGNLSFLRENPGSSSGATALHMSWLMTICAVPWWSSGENPPTEALLGLNTATGDVIQAQSSMPMGDGRSIAGYGGTLSIADQMNGRAHIAAWVQQGSCNAGPGPGPNINVNVNVQVAVGGGGGGSGGGGQLIIPPAPPTTGQPSSPLESGCGGSVYIFPNPATNNDHYTYFQIKLAQAETFKVKLVTQLGTPMSDITVSGQAGINYVAIDWNKMPSHSTQMDIAYVGLGTGSNGCKYFIGHK